MKSIKFIDIFCNAGFNNVSCTVKNFFSRLKKNKNISAYILFLFSIEISPLYAQQDKYRFPVLTSNGLWASDKEQYERGDEHDRRDRRRDKYAVRGKHLGSR